MDIYKGLMIMRYLEGIIGYWMIFYENNNVWSKDKFYFDKYGSKFYILNCKCWVSKYM